MHSCGKPPDPERTHTNPGRAGPRELGGKTHYRRLLVNFQRASTVSLGFVEGLNNKIRVIQRRAYGLRDEEYLRLKILTCMLPEL